MESPHATSGVQVSINFPGFALSGVPALALAAERAGFSALRVGDMQSTHREMYAALTLIGRASCRERVLFAV